ncbi:MAG: O-antigen ligase family protein [Gemmataceae bacterium]|nr:O-antigen ligase family protein [Gemmataceae bacterium]
MMEKGLIVTYLLTYGGAFVSLFNPFIGLLVYVCFAIIRPESLWHWSVPPGNYSRIVAIALLLGWAIHGFGQWRFGKARVIVWSLIGFWLWAALSATQAPNADRSWAFLEQLAKIVLPFLVGITLINSVAQLKQLAWVIVLSLGYVALDLNLSYYDGFNRLQLDGFGGMDNNSMAIALVTGVGLAFFLGLNAPKHWQMGLAFLAAGLMAHAVLFSFSRGGMLALALSAGMAVFLIRLQFRHFAVLAVAVLLGLRLAGPEVQERFLSVFVNQEQRDESAQSRVELWKDCLDATAKRPMLGLGPAHWPLVAAEYGWPPGKEAHTLWLQIAAELGIPGVTFLLAFYLMTMRRLWPIARGRLPLADPWLQQAASMVIAGLFGFMIAAQFVSLVGLELPYYATLLGAGVLRVVSLPGAATVPVPSSRLARISARWPVATA